MKNPFRYGEVVRGEDFADREIELEEIIMDMKAGQTIFLISPRRYGKTSLIMNALEKLQKEGFLTAYRLHPESQYRSRYILHLILGGDKQYHIEEHIH